MTEKRSDYQKRQNKKSGLDSFFNRKKDNSESVDVEPGFVRNNQENVFEEKPTASKFTNEDKSKRLKKRLNIAILLVSILLVIVLVILFRF